MNIQSEVVKEGVGTSALKRGYTKPALQIFGEITKLTQSYSCTDAGDNNAYEPGCSGGTMSMKP